MTEQLNLYGNLVICITNKIMSIFLEDDYKEYIVLYNNISTLDVLKNATNKNIMVYFINLDNQKIYDRNTTTNNIYKNNTCENLINLWIQRKYLNYTVNIDTPEAYSLYNKLFGLISNILTTYVDI